MKANKKQLGFTLPEVLVAVSILAIVLAAVYSVFWSGMMANSHAAAEVHIAARETLDLIGRDIRSACFKPDTVEFEFSGTSPGRANIESDTISFCTVWEPTPEAPRPVRVEYYLDDHPVTGKKILYRKTIPVFDYSGQVGETVQAVAPFVTQLDIRYYSDGTWNELWNNPEKLPEKVSIRLGMGTGEDGADEWFDSEISLPQSDREI